MCNFLTYSFTTLVVRVGEIYVSWADACNSLFLFVEMVAQLVELTWSCLHLNRVRWSSLCFNSWSPMIMTATSAWNRVCITFVTAGICWDSSTSSLSRSLRDRSSVLFSSDVIEMSWFANLLRSYSVPSLVTRSSRFRLTTKETKKQRIGADIR